MLVGCEVSVCMWDVCIRELELLQCMGCDQLFCLQMGTSWEANPLYLSISQVCVGIPITCVGMSRPDGCVCVTWHCIIISCLEDCNKELSMSAPPTLHLTIVPACHDVA